MLCYLLILSEERRTMAAEALSFVVITVANAKEGAALRCGVCIPVQAGLFLGTLVGGTSVRSCQSISSSPGARTPCGQMGTPLDVTCGCTRACNLFCTH